MATLNDSVLQGASGKIGGYVTYTVGNKTYARKLADTISNPRSEGQTAQRSKLPGVQTMYRATRGACWKKCMHSWPGKRNDAPATTGSSTRT